MERLTLADLPQPAEPTQALRPEAAITGECVASRGTKPQNKANTGLSKTPAATPSHCAQIETLLMA
jgi:hypothetical protein